MPNFAFASGREFSILFFCVKSSSILIRLYFYDVAIDRVIWHGKNMSGKFKITNVHLSFPLNSHHLAGLIFYNSMMLFVMMENTLIVK